MCGKRTQNRVRKTDTISDPEISNFGWGGWIYTDRKRTRFQVQEFNGARHK